jgi:hypothetical protein
MCEISFASNFQVFLVVVPSGYLTHILYAFIILCLCGNCPYYLIVTPWLIFCGSCKLLRSWLYAFFLPPVTFCQHMLFSASCSQTPWERFSFKLRDQVLHSYKAVCEIVLCVFNIYFSGIEWEDRRLWTGWQQALHKLNAKNLRVCRRAFCSSV